MILITMAGLSSRFFRAGYKLPKYMLCIQKETVFSHAIRSFEKHFKTEKFLFVARDIFNTTEFIASECQKLGITEFEIVTLEQETRGQAETAYLALKDLSDQAVTIFNIDTFRYNYSHPYQHDECDGYIEVFRGEGEHWSFVEPLANDLVLRTTEKVRISDLCSSGLYYFKSSKEFVKVFETLESNNITTKGEFYIAPMYNYFIKNNKIIKYHCIAMDDIDFCGTPAEYEHLLNAGMKNH
ncbi:glycosyltransferase family 2 protein [Pseudomonas putida]|uniref:glycosyltransferase family 2 protein n=1 Tax=Pseudomonas putida TaxID=303 RepID=UPI002117A19C|nr:glycosyltransferase family 2 protein [Pseudomonas putida]MDD2038664.1 glycosyltransferase family 2 protein [Pseudomonas putida]MDD2044391.1 glycosyltransferase family 2 protein [Pseudomonas putida]